MLPIKILVAERNPINTPPAMKTGSQRKVTVRDVQEEPSAAALNRLNSAPIPNGASVALTSSSPSFQNSLIPATMAATVSALAD